jgi:putative two-component system response regulator
VIFVTAIDDIENEARGFEAGCVDYIIKPVSEPLLRARVATHVRLSRQDQLLQSLLHERSAAESPLSTLGDRPWPSTNQRT